MKNMDDDSDARTEVSYSENEDENVIDVLSDDDEYIIFKIIIRKFVSPLRESAMFDKQRCHTPLRHTAVR